jgi:L-lysine exporter family protein LysE/ArgO
LAAPIGPINIEIVRRGIRDGFFHGWMVGLGALTADTFYALAIVLGFARFAENESIRVVLFLLGAGMMTYIGISSIRTALDREAAHRVLPAPPRGRSYATGFLMAAFNPFGIVYWLTVGAGLAADAVNRAGSGAAPVLVIGVMLGILAWVTTMSVIAQVSRKFVTGNGMRWITGLSGVLLIGFAAWFLVSGVRLLV